MHEFTGGGVTGVIALAESHVSIHTWPEEGIATIDVFMCGQCDPTKMLLPIRMFFAPKSFKIQEFKRALTPLVRS
jgi:S-adenosylmethionine decarboxylase